MLIKDIMSKPVVTIESDNSAYDTSRLMADRKIRRLVVLDKQGRLAGIVTERDIRILDWHFFESSPEPVRKAV